jgi:hypothetical protein
MKRYYLIDHKILFLFGYIFYLFTPYLIGVTDVFQGFPGMELYRGFFKRIPESKLITYAGITLFWLPSFYLGHLCFKFLKPFKRSLQRFPETAADKGLPYVILLLLFVLLPFTYISRNSIFGSYDSYDIGARGKMSTLLVVFNFFLSYQMITRQRVSMLLVIGTISTALLLLTMGGRMYVMQTFIIFLIYKTSFAEKRFTAFQIITVSILGFLIAGFVGVQRLGASFSIEKATYSLLAEPAFTWFSTSTYLISNDIPLFNIPQNFLTSFLNLVPNTFFSLQPYVVSTQAMVVNYESPLGADSIWTNIVINFGSVGSFFFLFITGFILNFLRHLSENNRFAAVYYIMVCSILPFQFFRDGFYILNKQLFFNFLILPGMVLITLKFLQYALLRLTPTTK